MEANKSNFYVTTAIHYANAKPHVGHALENVFGDVFYRYNKDLLGKKSYFLTGTDEHGQKINDKSAEMGFDNVQEFVDTNAAEFVKMNDFLEIKPSQFIRTTSEEHKRRAQAIWKELEAKGDIYKAEYEGLYCVGCEAYYLEKDLDEEGRCPIHLKAPKRIKEENYFFKLSKYSDLIKERIEKDELKIVPESRKKEFLSVLEEGLHDVSFSRNVKSMNWGIPVPGDEDHVMYVWCDALTNYITALGYGEGGELMGDFWPVSKHIIGKDILRFHAGIWIGMLMSLDLELPQELCVHGFINSGGHKMSKSLGNVIDPMEVAQKYGAEVLRFFLCREIPTGDDGDFNMERFQVVYTSDLQNNFGNLLSRSVSMVNKYLDGKVNLSLLGDEFEKFEFSDDYVQAFEIYKEGMDGFNIRNSIDAVLRFLSKLNQYIEEKQPWALNKEGKTEELEVVMTNLIYGIYLAARLLYPVIPVKSLKAMEGIGLGGMDVCSLDHSLDSGGLNVAEKIEPLFPRIEWGTE